MKKEKKECRIQLRLTPKEKGKLDRIIEKSGLKQSEFVRSRVFDQDLGNKESTLRCIEILVETADLIRHIEEKYPVMMEDSEMKKRVVRLWKKLQ